MLTPPLSTIETRADQIGYEAARVLTRLMSGHRRPERLILVSPGRLASRRSSDIIAVDDPDIASAVRYVRDNAHQSVTVTDILREVPISRRALERRFEKAIGRTPKAEIMRQRINQAKDLLRETDLRCAAIASRLGFTSPEKFSAAFRRKTSQTPTAYRESQRPWVNDRSENSPPGLA